MSLILIVEDNDKNLKLARDLLQYAGLRTLEATTAEDGIALAQRDRPNLVLMDIQLPGMDGIAALRKLRDDDRTSTIPVVALTASALEDAADRTRAAGCDAHVTKPVKKSTLLNAIRDAVEGNPPNEKRADSPNLKEEICQTE